MSWQLASFLIVAVVLAVGFAWYERDRPPSQVVALVAALAALAIAGRVAFAAFPNVKPTTDIVILAGYALGPAPGFAVGALTALVSNLWFGQGPWTPWQMAGWGMCGVLGAALSLRRRPIGRLELAAFCAAAGLAYGALLNFSLMATYGGELSLARFLALEARAIPFDLAHAAGNAVLALVAGPAMLRMLLRFRRRFEWRLRAPAAAAAGLVAALVLSLAPARAEAAATDRAVAWLAAAQNRDGGWGADRGRGSSPEITGWVMLGLEAAGRNPIDVKSGGNSPVDYLRRNVGDLRSSGDLARTILALEGAGVSSRRFGGRDLVEALVKRRRSNGSWEGWPGTTAFAVIALRTANAGANLGPSLSWLGKVQNDDGGWGDVPGSPSTADGTGAVMQAMPGTRAAERGLAFLRRAQRPNGGFAIGRSGAVNSQSTAWAVQGMIAVGADPARIRRGGDSARDYLLARQAGDGHFAYSASSDQTPVWVTGQVLAAVAGDAFPVSAPPPAKPKPAPSSKPRPSPAPAPSPSPGPSGLGSLPPPSSSGGAPGAGPGALPSPPAPSAPGAPPDLPDVPPPAESEGPLTAPPAGGTAAPPFEARESPPGPKPYVPLGVGLGTGGLALGSVLFMGRRFGW